MNELAQINETLPSLLDRAASALTGARTSAEVLEARDMARVAYDAAKSAGRMSKAKKAHDDVIAAVYRAQADAAVIEARAKVRLADEYDAAQERGEVATRENNPGSVGHVDEHNMPPATAESLGLRRDEIHDARKLRDAEAAEPGKIKAAADALVERGEEPTKAALRREVVGNAEAKPAAEVEPEDPKTVKLRREFRAMTAEAQEDDWVNLRLSEEEKQKRIRKQTHEIADLKARIKELEADDKNAVIVQQAAKIRHQERQMFKAQEEARKAMAAMHRAKKRVKELEAMEVDLG